MKQKTLLYSSRFAATVILVVSVGIVSDQLNAAEPQPCSSNSQTRELDFWLGDWTISAPGGSSGATSNVSLALDRCLIVENWDGGRGHTGRNFFGYSPDDQAWYGMFADNQGRVHIFTGGKVASGSAEFHGQSRGPKGEAVLNRIKVTRLTSDRIEQTWEKSSDNGASWKMVFRGEYTRRR